MTSFEYFSVALSFVLGLGVTRLLLAELDVFRARRNQKVHWIPITWAVSIFMFQIQFWWALFELNDGIETWTHGVFGTLLTLAILLFIAGTLILPATASQQRADLFEYFEEDGRWALLALAAYSGLSLWANWYVFDTSVMTFKGALVFVYGGLALASFLTKNRSVLGVLTATHLLLAIYAYLALAPAEYR